VHGILIYLERSTLERKYCSIKPPWVQTFHLHSFSSSQPASTLDWLAIMPGRVPTPGMLGDGSDSLAPVVLILVAGLRIGCRQRHQR
jgi:hypothetical protein